MMASSICWNRLRETMTSAIWKAIEQSCRTILVPTLTMPSRYVANHQCLACSGSAMVLRKWEGRSHRKRTATMRAPCLARTADDLGPEIRSQLPRPTNRASS